MKNKNIEMEVNRNKIRFLNHYYRLKKSVNTQWFEFDWHNGYKAENMLKYLKNVSTIKLIQTKNILLQKNEANQKVISARLVIPQQSENRYVGYFKDSTECSLLLIKTKDSDFIELFISETVRNNAFTLIQLLDSGKLEDEIKMHRNKYQSQINSLDYNKAVIIT